VVESDGGLEEFELQGVENDVLGGLDDLELDAGRGVSIEVIDGGGVVFASGGVIRGKEREKGKGKTHFTVPL
jgi:hypothetical protein